MAEPFMIANPLSAQPNLGNGCWRPVEHVADVATPVDAVLEAVPGVAADQPDPLVFRVLGQQEMPVRGRANAHGSMPGTGWSASSGRRRPSSARQRGSASSLTGPTRSP